MLGRGGEGEQACNLLVSSETRAIESRIAVHLYDGRMPSKGTQQYSKLSYAAEMEVCAESYMQSWNENLPLYLEAIISWNNLLRMLTTNLLYHSLLYMYTQTQLVSYTVPCSQSNSSSPARSPLIGTPSFYNEAVASSPDSRYNFVNLSSIRILCIKQSHRLHCCKILVQYHF